jgi:hypothetical protein
VVFVVLEVLVVFAVFGVVERAVVAARFTGGLDDVGVAAEVVVAVPPAGVERFELPDVDTATIPTTSSPATIGAPILAHTGRDRTQSSSDPVTASPSLCAAT